MMLDDWKSGKLSPDDPWAVEALKRGLIPPRAAEKPFDETAFQTWYKDRSSKLGINPNPDDPKHFYDYRAAYKAGAEPGPDGHWPSQFKREGHPRMVVDGVNTKTGLKTDQWKAGTLPETDPWATEALKRGLIQPRTPNPYTNPDQSPKETRGFQPDPMAEKVRGLPARLLPGPK